MSANAQGRSEKCTASSLQQFPGDMLNVPNNLVNIYQVTVLKHTSMYCDPGYLNLKIVFYFCLSSPSVFDICKFLFKNISFLASF